MTQLKSKFLAFIALFAAVAVASAAGAGLEPTAVVSHLSCCVEWLDGFTLHQDGAMAATAGAASPKVKELTDKVKALIQGISEKEEEIKDARDAAHDAKSKVEKMSLDNGEYVDELTKHLVQDKESKFYKQLEEILDERDISLQEHLGGTSSGRKALTKEIADKIVEGTKGMNALGGAGQSAKIDLGGHRLKDITNVPASGDALVDPDYREEIFGLQLRTPRITDLLQVFSTDSDKVEYVLQQSETDNASPQAGQGASLSQTDMTFSLESETVETIGHYAKASAQILDDAPRLRDFAQTRMRQLLELEIEDQVLLGDGTGNNLNGLVPRSTSYDTNLESAVIQGGRDVSDLDRIRIAMLQVQRANFAPTGIVLSPLNWTTIELEQTNEGAYRFVNPQNQTSPRLWGLPVVATNALPEGTGHVGNYQVAATLYDRMQTAIAVSTENATDFQELLVTFRAYARLALGVQYPEALISITNLEGTAPSTGSS